MNNQKPVAESCFRNQEPIFQVLQNRLKLPARLLELGSGTGQHAVYCSQRLSALEWQPSDVAECIPGIEQWRQESGCLNLLNPIELDVNTVTGVSEAHYDYVFMANTLHFVSESIARNFLVIAARALKTNGVLLAYGPFNENGKFTSKGNAHLDGWLKSRDPLSGIKDRNWVRQSAAGLGLQYDQSIAMPANNQILLFNKIGC